MNLGQQFRSSVVTAEPTDSIQQAAKKMHAENVGAVVVVEARKVVGILTDRDVMLAVAVNSAALSTPVRDVMTKDVVTIWEDQGIFNATQYLRDYGVRHLPVINRDNELVGMVTFDDIIALLGREIFNSTRTPAAALADKEPIR